MHHLYGSKNCSASRNWATTAEDFSNIYLSVNCEGHICPASCKDHWYVFMCVDFVTWCPEAVQLKNIDTESVAEVLVGGFFCVCWFGVPDEILSDQGSQFTSDLMRANTSLLVVTWNEWVDLHVSSHVNMTADVIPLCICTTYRTHNNVQQRKGRWKKKNNNIELGIAQCFLVCWP